ncbi:TRAP transporter substrate-binding protein [Sinanaerobacter chloroacetimidivorans]|jgi:tripartite ATP-independent transporter DctP family solute receptor|uniref:TRAP transporter substrate-binding protein n=1 Tax=Sinanaerobacter chloroacetimidivorans TaxID=2818044 RepID=A0A8J7VWW6_9FIRM|nr:TRAP transporter substrate-binding protein [Sinanaerobacter chloroacetimidivorans]MBR0596552.1 TRAP transporter substrate-binding protein [Sinanaerobacter chloroacetimidivorans]
MLKKSLSLLLVLALVLAAVTGCGSKAGNGDEKEAGTEGQTYTLRLGHVTQVTHPFHIGAQKFADKVAEKSDGRITVELFPARALGDDRELLEQVMNNTLDMGVISGPVFSAYTPVIDTLQLPFMLNTYEKELAAVQSEEMSAILDSLNQFNLKGLGVFEGGMRHLANAKKPIQTPEDLKGLKLRATQSDLVLKILTALGANPTPMAYGEVYTGLQTKVIDGEEINLTSISSEKHYEVLTNVTEMGLFPFPGICVMSQAKFDSLSEEDQQIITEAANEAMIELLGELPSIDQTAVENITANSSVEILTTVDTAPFKEKVMGIYDEYTAKNPLIKDFVEMAKGL